MRQMREKRVIVKYKAKGTSRQKLEGGMQLSAFQIMKNNYSKNDNTRFIGLDVRRLGEARPSWSLKLL